MTNQVKFLTNDDDYLNFVADLLGSRGFKISDNVFLSLNSSKLAHVSSLSIITDSFRLFEQGFIVFQQGSAKFSNEKDNSDSKENWELKYYRFKLCSLASIISIKTI